MRAFLTKDTPCQDLRESKNREGHYIANGNKWMFTHSHPPPKRTHNLGESFIPHQTGAGAGGRDTENERETERKRRHIYS